MNIYTDNRAMSSQQSVNGARSAPFRPGAMAIQIAPKGWRASRDALSWWNFFRPAH